MLIKCTAFLKSRALILTPFLIRNSHLRRTMAEVISRWLSPRRPSFNPKPVREEFFVNKYVQNCTPTQFRRYLLSLPVLHRPPEHWYLSYNLHCVTCHKNILPLYAKNNHVSKKEPGQIIHSSECVRVGRLVNGFHVRICSKHVSH